MEFGSDVLRTDITVGMELCTKNEYISRKIMDLIARETMKLDILVSRPDDAVTYHLKKLEGGFNVVAEDEVLFFGENIGIKIYSATTDISSVV